MRAQTRPEWKMRRFRYTTYHRDQRRRWRLSVARTWLQAKLRNSVAGLAAGWPYSLMSQCKQEDLPTTCARPVPVLARLCKAQTTVATPPVPPVCLPARKCQDCLRHKCTGAAAVPPASPACLAFGPTCLLSWLPQAECTNTVLPAVPDRQISRKAQATAVTPPHLRSSAPPARRAVPYAPALSCPPRLHRPAHRTCTILPTAPAPSCRRTSSVIVLAACVLVVLAVCLPPAVLREQDVDRVRVPLCFPPFPSERMLTGCSHHGADHAHEARAALVMARLQPLGRQLRRSEVGVADLRLGWDTACSSTSPRAAFNHVRVRHRHTLPRAAPRAHVCDLFAISCIAALCMMVSIRVPARRRTRVAICGPELRRDLRRRVRAGAWGRRCADADVGADEGTTGAEADDVAWLGGFRAGLRAVVLPPDSLSHAFVGKAEWGLNIWRKLCDNLAKVIQHLPNPDNSGLNARTEDQTTPLVDLI
ncbi:hypothetical protein GGX14DRAFT_403378 [Mycena pura]|uniref:Uncharacterized protein n=1 Tax=Mycena pura TaxID=153505 RepID=A0AAD6UWM9_9AGAR|nr:hypothetical protein GGX14DRAFT_403378 [Mycena pura]